MADRFPLIYNPAANQIQEISSSDSVSLSGSGLDVGIVTATAYSNLKTVTSVVVLSNSNFNYLMAGPITIGVGGTVSVAAGVSFVIA